MDEKTIAELIVAFFASNTFVDVDPLLLSMWSNWCAWVGRNPIFVGYVVAALGFLKILAIKAGWNTTNKILDFVMGLFTLKWRKPNVNPG